MPKLELTDRFCQTAKPEAGNRQTDYFDGITKGLSLLVSAGGTKAFYLNYTRKSDGKRQRIKLGGYPETTLGKAREKARAGRGQVSEGNDPLADKRALAASLTVSDMVENYLARKVAAKRSADEIARRLRKNVSNVIGDVKLSELHARDLTRAVDAVKDRGAGIEANRVFEDIRAMVRWAKGRGDLDQNITEGMQKPTETVERNRVLSPDEIKTMWTALASADMREGTRRVIRLCLITGQRVGEVCGMTTGELDLDAALWTIPAARAKNGREHKVPLSAMALDLIREQTASNARLAAKKGRATPTTFVFPAPGALGPLRGTAVASAIKREEVGATIMGVAPWTCHDLRRSMATAMEECGVNPFVIGHVLNHASATKATITSRVYARYDYGKEKRTALDLWAARLAGILDGRGEVVPLKRTG